MSKIVLYGGTFNPPHCGHVHAAEAAAKELRPDRLIIMPAGIPPHKQLSPGTPAPEDRLRMAELAFGHIPGAVISDFEIRKTGKCYTVDTVEEICRREPGCAVTLLTGSDMFLTLQDWYRAERLLSLCSVAVVSRDSEDDPKTLSEQKRRLKKTFGTDVVILKTPPLPASSSEIRAVDPGNDPSVPAEVRAYILQRKLYGNTIPDPVIRHLRCAAEEVLSS